MNNLVLHLLQTEGAPAQQSPFSMLFMFAIIIGIFYLLIIRPQSKRRKETERMLSSIKKGDKVVTIGGLHGVIQSVKETTVILKVDDNTKLEFLRSAISSIVNAAKEKEEKEDNADKSADKSDESGE